MLENQGEPRGVIVPLLTPFDPAGEVDEEALRRLVDHLVAAGVHGVMPCGTTGEGPLLTDEERRRVARTVVEQVRGRVPVIVQVGAISTPQTLALARHAWEVRADAIAVAAPFYYACTDAMLREHYSRVCAAVPDLPVYLYNIPQCTGNALSPALVAAIAADCLNVVGIKESSGDLGHAVAMLNGHRNGFQVIMGSDGLVLPALTMEIRASVSGNANVFPELFVDLFAAFWRGDYDAARAAQQRINTVRAVLDDGQSLALFKALAGRRGVPLGGVRPPLLGVSAATVDASIAALRAAGIWSDRAIG